MWSLHARIRMSNCKDNSFSRILQLKKCLYLTSLKTVHHDSLNSSLAIFQEHRVFKQLRLKFINLSDIGLCQRIREQEVT